MTHDEFIEEYYKVSARAIQLSEKARREGLLALDDLIDPEKVNQRDILELGLRFVIDGTDASVIRDILSRIIEQEEDKYTHRLAELKLEAVLSFQYGDHLYVLAHKLNAFTNLTFTDDLIIKKLRDETGDKGKLSKDEIDALIGGLSS